jgi:hypothetical protein
MLANNQPTTHTKTIRIRLHGKPDLWSPAVIARAEQLAHALQSPFTMGNDTHLFRLDQFSADQFIATLEIEGNVHERYYFSSNGSTPADALEQLFDRLIAAPALLSLSA